MYLSMSPIIYSGSLYILNAGYVPGRLAQGMSYGPILVGQTIC